jgi:hypothetical protein
MPLRLDSAGGAATDTASNAAGSPHNRATAADLRRVLAIAFPGHDLPLKNVFLS